MGLQHLIEAGAKPRELRRQIHAENREFGPVLTDVPVTAAIASRPGAPVRALRSRAHLVQVFAEADGVVRLSVQRTDIRPDGEWADGISWDDLQRLKAEAGYGDREAVEVYPPDADVVNVAAIRHLWVLPEGERVPFSWASDRAGDAAIARAVRNASRAL